MLSSVLDSELELLFERLTEADLHTRMQGNHWIYISLVDARKGLKMFEKVEVPVLGIVENMSIHICSNCGQKIMTDHPHEETVVCQECGSVNRNRVIKCDVCGGDPACAQFCPTQALEYLDY